MWHGPLLHTSTLGSSDLAEVFTCLAVSVLALLPGHVTCGLSAGY